MGDAFEYFGHQAEPDTSIDLTRLDIARTRSLASFRLYAGESKTNKDVKYCLVHSETHHLITNDSSYCLLLSCKENCKLLITNFWEKI